MLQLETFREVKIRFVRLGSNGCSLAISQITDDGKFKRQTDSAALLNSFWVTMATMTLPASTPLADKLVRLQINDQHDTIET
jgi:hypothetical protein